MLYSLQGKHTTAWGLFRTSSSDCSYFLAFQDEQFHLGFTKEETLTAAVVPAENKTRKAGKHVEEYTIPKVRKAGCPVAFVKSHPGFTDSISSHICLVVSGVLRYTCKYSLGGNAHKT